MRTKRIKRTPTQPPAPKAAPARVKTAPPPVNRFAVHEHTRAMVEVRRLMDLMDHNLELHQDQYRAKPAKGDVVIVRRVRESLIAALAALARMDVAEAEPFFTDPWPRRVPRVGRLGGSGG